MNLLTLTSADFKAINRLLQKKDALRAGIAQIDAQLAAYETASTSPAAKRPPARKRAGKKARRGEVKTMILQMIQAAGKAGVTVRDIARQLGANPNRIHTWFYNTGKRVKEIKKVGPSTYVWTA